MFMIAGWDIFAISDPAAAAKAEKAVEIADKYREVYERYEHRMHEARHNGPARAEVERQMKRDPDCRPCHGGLK